MRLSVKEKAGVIDTSRIFEGLHLTEGFIKNSVLRPDVLADELKEVGNKHFEMCDKCRHKKESFLPLPE